MNLKRPFLIVVIGFLIGIIWGLYFEINIVLFYFLITIIYLIQKNLKSKTKFKLFSFHRYFRYLKLIISKQAFMCIIIISIVSNIIIMYEDKKYNIEEYVEGNLTLIGVIESDKIEKEYQNTYKFRVIEPKNLKDKCFYINVKKQIEFEYGDKVKVFGEIKEPEKQRNYGGFDYKQYLKTKKIVGIIKTEKVEILAHNKSNFLFQLSNKLSNIIKRNIDNIFKEQNASIIKALILGDNSEVEEEIQENFRATNISHILAVSGMHVGYITIAISFISEKVFGKRKSKFITIIFLVFYMFLTGFSPSVVRSCIMMIIYICGTIFHRRADTWNQLGLSLCILLLYNPFSILNIGLQLSYLGTMGIILFYSKVERIIGKILGVTIAAQFAILPIILYHFNIFSSYFLITNFLISILIGPIIITSFANIVISFFSFTFSKILSIPLNIGIDILLKISSIADWKFSKIYISTPKLWMIILYYIILVILSFIYYLYKTDKITITKRRFRNILALFKSKVQKQKNKVVVIFVVMMIFILIVKIVPKDLRIYFIDVGQGDSTFIVTPSNKTILIDGGGSLSNEFDVGKQVVLPYILDRGYTKIDYIMISHFDQDHCRTEF